VLRVSGYSPSGTLGVIRLRNFGAPTVRDDWSVELKGLEGQRVFRLTGLPADWMLKGVYLDGREISDTPLDIREDIQGVQFVVTNLITRVLGTVADARGQTAREYTVLIFADDSTHWTPLSRFRTIARPDQNGEFKAEKLPPATTSRSRSSTSTRATRAIRSSSGGCATSPRASASGKRRPRRWR